jgi:hypothetical protein
LKTLNKLFLAWQDPIGRSWFPIGRLTFDGESYKFVYTQGVKEAQAKCAFKPLASFPRLDEIYTSTHLFPVFSNRLMSRSRPDYQSFIQWLNIPEEENNPIAILARSGGERQTDTLTVFPYPEPDAQGRYHLHFFSHGLRHLPSNAIERINLLPSGERLWLAHEFQNSYEEEVLTLNTEDHHIVGYCPRFLRAETFVLLRQNSSIEVRVEQVNQPPTPLQFRLLCCMTTVCIEDSRPFCSSQYQPLIDDTVSSVTYI